MRRRVVRGRSESWCGGRVGVVTRARASGREGVTIEAGLEPFLIQQGYRMRTPRGRMVTRAA